VKGGTKITTRHIKVTTSGCVTEESSAWQENGTQWLRNLERTSELQRKPTLVRRTIGAFAKRISARYKAPQQDRENSNIAQQR